MNQEIAARPSGRLPEIRRSVTVCERNNAPSAFETYE